MSAKLIRDNPQAWQIEGELNFASVPPLLRQIEQLLGQGAALPAALDLSRLRRADSAGLALLVDLRGYARGAATPLQFRSPPPQLLHLAEASGLSLWFETDGQASQ